MIDTRVILANVDLLKLIEKDLGRPLKKSGRYVFFKCPFHHEDTPSFGVTSQNGRYYCFGCGKSGDAISWLMDFHQLSFQDACDTLTGGKPLTNKWVTRDPCADEEKSLPDPDTLQEAWKEVVRVCAENLYKPEGALALEYLHSQRKLTDKTLKREHVGYSAGQTIAGIWVEKSVVLPCVSKDYVHYVKLRLPQGKPKYVQLNAEGFDINAVYGSDMAMGADVVFVTEGEFDCLLLSQEAGDLIGSVTLGSATQKLEVQRRGRVFELAEHVVVCMDNDDAGVKGREKWQEREIYPCFRDKMLYTSVPQEYKDITDFAVAGGNLGDWVMKTLGQNGIE